MILRSWRGIIRTEDREEYAAYLAQTGLREYRSTPGNVDAYAVYRDLGDSRTEVTTLSLWQSADHIRAFAGERIGIAVFYPEDDRYLLVRDLTVTHSDVVQSDTAQARPEIPRLDDVIFDCPDAAALAAFWGALLDRPVRRVDDDWFTLDGSSPRLSFQQVEGYRAPEWPLQTIPQQAHVDLVVDDLIAADTRAIALGATVAREIHDPGEEPWRVYLDPVGHPFCLVTVRAASPTQE